MDNAATYRIEVRGELDPRWAERLGGMAISTKHEAGHKTVTALEEQVRDQAALAGIMSTLQALHLVVLSVCCLDNGEEKGQG